MSNTIEVVNICPTHNEDEQPVEPPEDVEPEQAVVMKKPRAKRVAKPKEESSNDLPKAKRAPRKPKVVVDEEPEIVELPPTADLDIEEEEPEHAPLPPPPLVREKKARAKRAPRQTVDEYAAPPDEVSNRTLTDQLAQHIMDLRCRKVELKQQRIQNMVAGQIA